MNTISTPIPDFPVANIVRELVQEHTAAAADLWPQDHSANLYTLRLSLWASFRATYPMIMIDAEEFSFILNDVHGFWYSDRSRGFSLAVMSEEQRNTLRP